jgi:membrane protein DedA with SNARE-associated domain
MNSMSIWHHLSRWLLDMFYHHEFLILFLLMLIESAGVPLPLPGDSFVALAATRQPYSLGYEALVTGTILAGTLIGATILFFISRAGGRPLLDRYGKYILLEQKRLHKVEDWFRRSGRWVIIAGWLIPGLRIPTVVMVGLSGMTYLDFLPMAALACFTWTTLYFWVGVFLAAHGTHIVHHIAAFAESYARDWVLATLIAIVIFIVGLVIRQAFLRGHRKRRHLPFTRQHHAPMPHGHPRVRPQRFQQRAIANVHPDAPTIPPMPHPPASLPGGEREHAVQATSFLPPARVS